MVKSALLVVLSVLAVLSPHTLVAAQGTNPRPTNTDIDRGSYTTCPQVPTLHCQNGSTCTQGIATYDARHDHLNLQTHESGYYCKCIPGYIGHECQVQIDDCDGDTGYNPSDPTGVLTSCYHGSSCKSNASGFYCDCNTLNGDSGPTAKKFAGLMCQHESTSMCAASLVGSATSGHSFCTNHGKCVKMVVADQPHPGCVCRDGWAGDHCELLEETEIKSRLQEGAEGGGNVVVGKVLFSLLIIAMGCVVTGIAVLLVKARKDYKADVESGNSAVLPAEMSAAKKIVLGEGDLEADGSGTLGNLSKDQDVVADNDGVDADGDLELTLTEEVDEAPPAVDDSEDGVDDSEDGPAEPEIV